jgi:hypothetical protein
MNRLFIMTILAVAFLAFYVVAITLMLCNRLLGKWACRWLGWHLEPHEHRSDGCSSVGRCPRCGALVLQDSQGNWSALTQDNP